MNYHIARGARCFLITTAGVFFISHFGARSIFMGALSIAILTLCACYIIYEMFHIEEYSTFSTLFGLSILRTVLAALLRSHESWFGNINGFVHMSNALIVITIISFIARCIREEHKKNKDE